MPFQFTPCIAVNTSGTATTIVSYGSQAYPSGASAPSLTAVGVVASTFQGSGTPSTVDGTHAIWSWSSTQSGGSVNAGLQLIVGQIFKLPASANIKIGFKIKTTVWARLSEVRWEVHAVDGSGTPGSGSRTLTDGVWDEFESASISLTGWTGKEIALTLNAKGTTNSANIGATDFYVEYIYVIEAV